MARIPLKEGLLSSIEAGADPRLLAARCSACMEHHFPATDICPYCSAGGCTVVAVGPQASLFVYTVVEKPPPGYRGPVPYGFGVVELAEGFRVITRLTETALGNLRFGMSMRLVLEELFENEDGDTVVGWAFAPAEAR